MDIHAARTDQPPPSSTARVLDDPAWFGAVMGTGAVSAVAALNPGGGRGNGQWHRRRWGLLGVPVAARQVWNLAGQLPTIARRGDA